MKRDMDLIRKILLALEEASPPGLFLKQLPFSINGYSQQLVGYHLLLLEDAGYVRNRPVKGDEVYPLRMTNQGHEFLDVARNEKGWKEVTEKAAKAVGGVGLSVLREMLSLWVKTQVGLT